MYLLNRFDNRFLRILIVALLILCLVYGGIFVQYTYADVLVGGVLVVVACILVACGFMASSQQDLEHAAQDCYNSMDSQAKSDANSLAQNWVEGMKMTFKCTKAILSAVAAWIAAQDWTYEQVGGNTLGGCTLSQMSNINIDGYDMSWMPCVTLEQFDTLSSDELLSLSLSALFFDENTYIIPVFGSLISGYDAHSVRLSRKISSGRPTNYISFSFSTLTNPTSYTSFPNDSLCTFCTNILLVSSSSGFYLAGYGGAASICWRSVHIGSSSTVLEYPQAQVQSDSTYFPQEVVDAAGGTTAFPDQTASNPLTTDIPLTIPQEGVNSTTLPQDVRGESQAGTDEGEGELSIPGWLGKIWEGVTSIPASIGAAVGSITSAIGDAVGSIADTLTNFFNPSNFKLDFSKFKFDLTQIFPFCIPFDLVRGVNLLAASSEGFVFNIKLDTTWFSIDHTVNLQPFRIPILFFRFICDFWFGYILISRTRDWIKW